MKWRSFEEARKFVHKLNLKSRVEWNQYCKTDRKPDDIPKDVASYYNKQGTWTNWPDFLGHLHKGKREVRPFKDVAEFAQKLGIKSSTEWWAYVRVQEIPSDITRDPSSYFKKEWTTWGDFLGTGYVSTTKRKFRPFAEAKKYAQALGFTSQSQWAEYCKSGKNPPDIPAAADNKYKKEWVHWPDFLGYQSKGVRKLRSFAEAKKYVHAKNLKNRREWMQFSKSGKLPNDIPSNPRTYSEFTTWGDWLGTGRLSVTALSKTKRPFQQAREFVQGLKLASIADWNKYCKSGEKPNDIPAQPKSYKKEWTKWGDWLGTGTLSSAEKAASWLPPKEARIEIARLAKDVFGGKGFSPQDWYKAHDEGKIPKNLPKNLDDIYNPYSRDNRKKRKKK